MVSYLDGADGYVFVNEFQVFQFGVFFVCVFVNHFDDSVAIFAFKRGVEEVLFVDGVIIGKGFHIFESVVMEGVGVFVHLLVAFQFYPPFFWNVFVGYGCS